MDLGFIFSAGQQKETSAVMAKATGRRYLEEAECNGITYHVGCSAYVVLDAEASTADSELEVCEVCQKTYKKRGRKEVPMLECDKCLHGFHLDCLEPPLKAVPEVQHLFYEWSISIREVVDMLQKLGPVTCILSESQWT